LQKVETKGQEAEVQEEIEIGNEEEENQIRETKTK